MNASNPQYSLQLRLLGTHGSSISYGLRDFCTAAMFLSNGSS